MVVYFGVWLEILTEKLPHNDAKLLKNVFLVSHKRGSHCSSQQKVDVYGWEKHCNTQ